MSESRELDDLIEIRGETPVLVEIQPTGFDSAELYRFADGTEVIVTNGGLVTEDDAGFADLRGIITGDLTVRADEEYGPDEFWGALRDQFPQVASRLASGDATVTIGEFRRIRDLPGFDGGPAYAPTALIIVQS